MPYAYLVYMNKIPNTHECIWGYMNKVCSSFMCHLYIRVHLVGASYIKTLNRLTWRGHNLILL